MKAVLAHYQGDWTWVKDFSNDLVIYNRSEEDIPGSFRRENLGDADFDKLTYLIDNYYDLPEVFLWSKSNLFKFITPEEFDEVKENQEFMPLLTKNHKTYSDGAGQVCYYQDGWYYERNNSWFLQTVPAKYVSSWNEWADIFHLPKPDYIPFSPGGSYILTREKVHMYGIDLYKKMASMLPYCQNPGEAHCAERSYGLLWGGVR